MPHSTFETSDHKIRLVTFFIGSNRFGFETRFLRSIQVIEENQPKIDDILSVEEFLGLSKPITEYHSHSLSFIDDVNETINVLITAPVELVDLSPDSIFLLPPLLKARVTYPNVCALGQVEDNIFYLLKIK